MFHYTRWVTPKRVTSWRGPSLRHWPGQHSSIRSPGNTAPFEEMSQRWRAVGNTVSDLTGPRFEPQTSRSRDERVTARPTGRSPPRSILLLITVVRDDTKKTETEETIGVFVTVLSLVAFQLGGPAPLQATTMG